MHTKLLTVLFSSVLLTALIGCGKKEESVTPAATATVASEAVTVAASNASAAAAGKITTHVVKKGEIINTIADRYRVAREGVILTNANLLIKKYQETCPATEKKNKKGLFCNDSYKRAWANTLLPGWVLQIETTDHSASALGQVNTKAIDAAMADLPKNTKLAIVLDVSESMSDKMNRAAQYVMSTRKQSGGQLFAMYVYHESVARIEDVPSDEKLMLSITTNSNKLHGRSDVENTKQALKKAFADGAEHVLVISDEEGDDWGNWSEVKTMRPVTAVCMARMSHTCFESFKKLADMTKGKYVRLD